MTDTPFFILASPRSGTTLLERIINRHSRFFVPPETAFFHHLRMSGYMYRPCTKNTLRAFTEIYLATHAARLLGLGTDPALIEEVLQGAKRYVDLFFNLAQILRRSSGKPRFGEKTPHHLRCVEYLAGHIQEARFVGMLRDGRAVVRSRLTHPNWEHNLVAASRVWREDVRLLLGQASGRFASRFHLIKYEDLLAEPERILSDLCAFLGETFEPGMLQTDEIVDPQPESFAAYYQRAWMSKSKTPIDPSRADAWHREYTPNELALVEHILGHELARCGYALMAPRAGNWQSLYVKEWTRHLYACGYRYIMKHRSRLRYAGTRRP